MGQSDQPLVSICIPCYCPTNTFTRLLDSIRTQTYKLIELVISDDSPESGIQSIIEQSQLKIPVHYRHNQFAMGAPENWNAALSLGHGEILKLMHQDDFFIDNYAVESMVDCFLKNSHAQWLFCNATAFRNNEKVFDHTPTHQELENIYSNPLQLLLRNRIGPPSSIAFRKSVSTQFDSSYVWLSDAEFYIRCIRSYGKPIHLEKLYIGVTVDGASQLTRICEKNVKYIVGEPIRAFIKHNGFDRNIRLELFNLAHQYGVYNTSQLRDLCDPIRLSTNFIFYFYLYRLKRVFL